MSEPSWRGGRPAGPVGVRQVAAKAEITGLYEVRAAAKDRGRFSSRVSGDADVRDYPQLPLAVDPILIAADHHYNGAQHSFTARVDIVEVGTEATMNGVVTEGWLKDNLATGAFSVVQCAHDGVTTRCFTGYLDMLTGTKQREHPCRWRRVAPGRRAG